jgi:hypothetical protein
VITSPWAVITAELPVAKLHHCERTSPEGGPPTRIAAHRVGPQRGLGDSELGDSEPRGLAAPCQRRRGGQHHWW